MSRALAIGYLTKVSAGNVNASHTEGNVVVTKKLTLPDGSTRPYVSGQAIRRMLRDRLADLGWALSEAEAQVNGQEVTPPVRPQAFIDEDLFGYLDASGSRRRTSPVRVSAAVGAFSFEGDRDLGTRSFERFGVAMGEGGNMFETEIYANLFRGGMLVELDRVGVFTALELEGEGAAKKKGAARGEELPAEERRRRVRALLDALLLLWGGGRTARMLVDFSPHFVAIARMKAKHPVFLEALEVGQVDGRPVLRIEPLEGALARFREWCEKVHFGIDPGFLANETELRERLKELTGGDVDDVRTAVDAAKRDLDEAWNPSSA